MQCRLTKQGQNYFINKYRVKKSLINSIENKVNSLRIVENNDDYFTLINNIVCNVSKTNLQIEEFSSENDKLKLKMNIDDFIIFEVYRLYGKIDLDIVPIKMKIKFKKGFYN